MQPISLKRLACAACLVGLAGGQLVLANVEGNPYATIVDRNPFGLKPPPPPPPPPEQTAPPVPMAQITLTGLLSTFGEPRAILEIIEEPGKGGGTPKRPPPMREGERLGPVEILGIDVVKNLVRVRNSGVETNITFAVVKSTPTPGGPGVPGAAPLPSFTPPPLSAAAPHPAASGPTVISANGASPNGGVTLMGGGAAAPMSTMGTMGAPNAAAYPAAYAGAGPGALGAPSGGSPTIPSRPLRTDNNYAGANTANANNSPPLTREQADLLIEMSRLRGQEKGGPVPPPLPPTSLTPIIEGAAAEADQPNNMSAFPQLPSARGLKPPGRR